MLQNSRQPLMFMLCTVIALDIVFLLGGSSLLDVPESNPDWLCAEFELEESEDSVEEETLIQDAEFSVALPLLGMYAENVDFSVKESDRDEIHISRGPPALS
ncbi:hypothetical protein [Gimesia maris]|uniref:Uncharacterized protein n=1 Tax=Gimesia maris TaxID=122 RepID=A0A3D3R9D1_9PLAN|nr:hypothetical protein [Gimesia maris]MAC54117.1 hypothetical protein [Gimesia sp.]QDU16864.1 hypothetical protein CA11_47000 [Gimesia maris]HAW29054.1 hypothetical protein [Planctomycetaceae bacterium]HCO24692.1 hypothetical protein [Gimesia maris]|tara:strand:+ start:3984 stop:4289 length:306 start_codon:yes stop_codon:yes gene_type:complete